MREKNKKIITIPSQGSTRFRRFLNVIFSLRKIADVIKEINPHFVIFEGGSWCFYFFILFQMLREFKIIYHAHNVEYEIRKQKENKVIQLLTFLSESYLLKKAINSFLSLKEILNYFINYMAFILKFFLMGLT